MLRRFDHSCRGVDTSQSRCTAEHFLDATGVLVGQSGGMKNRARCITSLEWRPFRVFHWRTEGHRRRETLRPIE